MRMPWKNWLEINVDVLCAASADLQALDCGGTPSATEEDLVLGPRPQAFLDVLASLLNEVGRALTAYTVFRMCIPCTFVE